MAGNDPHMGREPTQKASLVRPHRTASTASPAPLRYDWIDVARGIGISLVIFGHVIISSRDAGQISSTGFWADVIFTIYTFHMPVFLFLAGLSVQRRLKRGVSDFLKPMLRTIVWPYVLWGSLILFAEWLGRDIRNPVDTSAVDISLLWTPIAWLWFLWALGIYHLLAVVFRRSMTLLVAVALGALVGDEFITLPPFPHELAHFMIFYVSGVVLGQSAAQHTISPRTGLCAIALFAPLVWAPNVTGQDAWSFAATGAAITGTIATLAMA